MVGSPACLLLVLLLGVTHAWQQAALSQPRSRQTLKPRLPAVIAEETEGFTFGDGEVSSKMATVIAEEEEMTEKQKEIARLRAAEKFMKKDTGDAICRVCQYYYKMEDGDGRIPRNTPFQLLPDNYACVTCGSPKPFFDPVQIEIAGFADNQDYGFFNGQTEEQKSGLIFGGLFAAFLLLLSGYALN